uniref:Reverse transcriptase n=1 Tax=Panagrolaimus davidi TaxID=227884 RepID=A0A914QGG2_9BILA
MMIYVDNLLQGSDTPEEAIFKAEVARDLLKEGDMNLRMFQSNCSAVNEHFENTDTATKLLGINWNLEEDQFIIGWPKVDKCPSTKRELLSFTATPFDPLQILSPCLVHLKLLVHSYPNKCHLVLRWCCSYIFFSKVRESQILRS